MSDHKLYCVLEFSFLSPTKGNFSFSLPWKATNLASTQTRHSPSLVPLMGNRKEFSLAQWQEVRVRFPGQTSFFAIGKNISSVLIFNLEFKIAFFTLLGKIIAFIRVQFQIHFGRVTRNPIFIHFFVNCI